MIIKFGNHQRSLICDRDKVNQIVNDLITRFDDTFTFMQLCSAVRTKADEEGLFDKEPNTQYEGQIELSYNDLDTINLIVWEMIWAKHLMIVLYKNPYDGEFLLKKV